MVSLQPRLDLGAVVPCRADQGFGFGARHDPGALVLAEIALCSGGFEVARPPLGLLSHEPRQQIEGESVVTGNVTQAIARGADHDRRQSKAGSIRGCELPVCRQPVGARIAEAALATAKRSAISRLEGRWVLSRPDVRRSSIRSGIGALDQ
jgi:hypothetical protein